MKESMTPKERYLAVLNKKIPDRIPMDWWATGEVNEMIMKHLGVSSMEEVYKKLHIDKPFGVYPEYKGPKIPEGYDIYGCKHKEVKYKTGTYSECIFHPLEKYNSVEEIEKNYTWPSVDWFDFSGIKKQLEGKEDYPVLAGGSEPFLRYKKLRGEEQAFIDLIENPEIVHYCLDKLYSFSYEFTRRIYETIPGKVNMSYVAEDMGGQDSLMYSPSQIREFFLPWMKKMADLVHQAGAFVFHHDDGAIRDIIPDMIDIVKIDILNPIQWRCKGMDRKELKETFGEKIVFHGAVDNQHTLPFGTTEEVRDEVIYNIEVLGKGGGYILAPCHNIQPLTPVENIIALYETGYENGWY
ncbi:uroporphyrinogen-III decarboxylase-like protein [bacterium]|nr:uroporphyrinogen-III decarboxylase-like protein [bacterium]